MMHAEHPYADADADAVAALRRSGWTFEWTLNSTDVYSADGVLRGQVRGEHRCRLSGCVGVQLNVLWPDGRRTWPCVRGMFRRTDGNYQIRSHT